MVERHKAHAAEEPRRGRTYQSGIAVQTRNDEHPGNVELACRTGA